MITTILKNKNKTIIRGEEEMKTEKHYDSECLFYLKNARDEWVDVYEVYGYEEEDGVRHKWFLPSVKVAKEFVSDYKTKNALVDFYIRELQCYVDDVGLIWVKYVNYITND